MVHSFSSKFLSSPHTFTSLDTANVNQNINKNHPISVEPTSSGTRYILTTDGTISKDVLSRLADDDEETASSSDDSETDEETKVHTTTRANAFPKIVFFGTGSSFSGVTRTTTAILVHTS